MPSPIGHTLAGLTVGWLSEGARPAGRNWWRDAVSPFVLWCACAAALPDADLLIPHFHRTATHSVTATALTFIVAMVVTGKVTRHRAWRFAVALAVAHSTHLLLDWLGADPYPPPGIQALWPFKSQFYISGLDLFPPVERRLLRPEAIAINARAAIWEVLIMGPIAAAAWAIGRKRRADRRTGERVSEAPRS